MNKISLLIGVFFSMLVCTSAQEKKKIVFLSPQDTKFFWDIVSPVVTIDGDTITYLEIATINQIAKIEFRVDWSIRENTIVSISHTNILRSATKRWQNDLPDIFPGKSIWYAIYILPAPTCDPWEIKSIKFSGRFLTGNTWKDMGQNFILCHQGKK